MIGTSIVLLYAAIAAYVTAHVFYHGVVLGPAEKLFTATDQVILTLASIGVGAAWLLFLPGLVVLTARQVGDHLHSRPELARIRRPEHARAGS